MSQMSDHDQHQAPPTTPEGPKLDTLSGMSEARAWTDALIKDFKLWKERRLPWGDVDHACILHGPPGTGKTTCARAVAATLRVPHIAASFAIWQGSPGGHLGTTIEAMKATFASARKYAPCVVSIDEIDSIPTRATDGSSNGYFNAFTNAMLTELDTAARTEGVIIIGTCNHPELLDPALIRPGRMDRLLEIHLPNMEELQGILRFHLTAPERNLLGPAITQVAALCVGFSGADVEQAVRSARRTARSAQQVVSLTHFEAVLDPPNTRLSSQNRKRVALHEAGHAAAAWVLLKPLEIAASIVARGASAGRVTIKRAPGPTTKSTLEALIAYQLAGRAAEQHFLSDVSDLSGGRSADSDLALATRFATEAILTLGFSGEHRLPWAGNDNALNKWREDGPIALEVRRILDQAYAQALSLVESQKDKVHALAEGLLLRRVLAHSDIEAIMCGRPLPEPPPAVSTDPIDLREIAREIVRTHPATQNYKISPEFAAALARRAKGETQPPRPDPQRPAPARSQGYAPYAPQQTPKPMQQRRPQIQKPANPQTHGHPPPQYPPLGAYRPPIVELRPDNDYEEDYKDETMIDRVRTALRRIRRHSKRT